MSLYEADGSKQKPIARDGTGFYSHATVPSAFIISKRPSYVIINNVGTYKFMYESGSYGSNYLTGSVRAGTSTTTIGGNLAADASGSITATGGTPGPIRLDINPISWDRSDASGTVGDITFVYVRPR